MLTLEDYVEKLDEINWDPPCDSMGNAYGINNTWDRKFISEVAYHTRDNGKPLSTGQVGVITRLLERYRVQLELMGADHKILESVITNQPCRQAPTQSSTVKREVRWMGGSDLAFRFKFHPEIKEALKAFKITDCFGTHKTVFSPKHKLWIVPVSVANYEAVIEVISRYGFSFDDTVAEFLTGVANCRLQKTHASIQDGEICIEAKDDALMCEATSLFADVWKTDV